MLKFPPLLPAIPRQFRAEMAAEKEARQAETAEAQDAAKDADGCDWERRRWTTKNIQDSPCDIGLICMVMGQN